MSVGQGPSAKYDIEWLDAHSTEAVERTSLEILTPYGIPGLALIDRVVTKEAIWSVSANSKVVPPEALEPHLQGTTLELDGEGFVKRVISGDVRHNRPKKKLVHLEADRWGRSWTNEVWLDADEYIGPDNPSAEESPSRFAESLLVPACHCLNRILDALVYAGGPADLPLVLPKDFWAVRARYYADKAQQASVAFTHLQRLWWRGPLGPGQSVLEEANELLGARDELPVHESLLVSARRKLNQGDYRGAIIDSISAAESLLSPVISTALGRQGVSKGKRRSYLGAQGIGLSLQMNVAIPSLFGEDAIEKSLRNNFSQASGKRNRIVHHGDDANCSEAATHLATCSEVVDQLMAIRDAFKEADQADNHP